jgi:UPF0755 protein
MNPLFRRLLRVALVLALAAMLAAALLLIWLDRRLDAPLPLPEDGARFVIEQGESLAAISRRLQATGWLPQPWLLRGWGRFSGDDARIRHGEYRLRPGLSVRELLALLASGRVLQYQVTLPEGITLVQALQRLAAAPALRVVLSGPEDPALLALVAPHTAAEGLFLPETWRYERGDSDLQILARAHRALEDELARAWAGRAEGLPLESPYEALILASIIERETGVPAERGEIAGVFVRRLQRGMRLQTDPTIIYGLGEGFDGNLRRSHLEDAGNRYNTYRHHGLPPTPIALPGRAAIRAALQPAAGESLYFVARGDGSHVFSSTLEAHRRAVRKYQLSRREDYRSSPPPSSQ